MEGQEAQRGGGQAKNSKSSSTDRTSVPNWQQVFKHDTEAGRLLSRLYGFQSNQSKISYPKLKQKAAREDLSGREPWNQRKKQDIASSTKGKSAVKVPKVGQRAKNNNTDTSALNKIPRRKTEASCKNTLEKNFVLNSSYRPPGRVSDIALEKERLCELHEYGGGRALPNELTLPQQVLPSHLKEREKVMAETAKSLMKRRSKNGVLEDSYNIGSEQETVGKKCERDTVSDQIVREIEERKHFQLEMEKMGAGESSRQKIVQEISSRMKELSVLDKEKFKILKKSYDSDNY